ncbi:8406_t:CDS:2, partial [Cetraspora pellucida]
EQTTNHTHCHPGTNFKTDKSKEDNNKTEIKKKSLTKEQTTSHIPYYRLDANLKTSEPKENNNKVSRQKSKESHPQKNKLQVTYHITIL